MNVATITVSEVAHGINVCLRIDFHKMDPVEIREARVQAFRICADLIEKLPPVEDERDLLATLEEDGAALVTVHVSDYHEESGAVSYVLGMVRSTAASHSVRVTDVVREDEGGES